MLQKLVPELYDECLKLRKEMQWTKLMDHLVGRMMREHGVSRDALAACLRGIPYFEGMFAAAKYAASLGAKMFIISDSNDFYIQEILDQHGLSSLWLSVHTNKVAFEDDVLRIHPYHPSENDAHGCNRCAVNMCKGQILESILSLHHHNNALDPSTTTRRIVYVGDGGGDLCPCLSCLCEGDVICCRRDWKLHADLIANTEHVKAIIEPWENGDEVLAVFQRVIDEMNMNVAK